VNEVWSPGQLGLIFVGIQCGAYFFLGLWRSEIWCGS